MLENVELDKQAQKLDKKDWRRKGVSLQTF